MKRLHFAYSSRERELRRPILITSFSNFDAVLHILFRIYMEVIDKLNESKFLRDS